MNSRKPLVVPANPLDLDFTGHFDATDLRAELTPPIADRGPVVSPDFLIGADRLAQNHHDVNVSRPRSKRTDPIDASNLTALVMEDDNTTRNIHLHERIFRSCRVW